MKIVHVCLTGGYTEGINYQENYLTKYQALDGHKVWIITTQYCWYENIWAECFESDYDNEYGVRVIRIPYRFHIPYKLNTYLGCYKGLAENLEKIDPEIIFVHNCQFQDIRLIGRYKQQHSHVRIFVDNHSDYSNSARGWISRNILYKFYWKNCVQAIEPFIEKFWGVLPARVEFLKEIYGIPATKCDLLVMGADDEIVDNISDGGTRKKFREKYGIQDDDFLIMTGGKIDSFKLQTLFLMEAVKKIENKNLKLCVFGSVEEGIKDKFEAFCDGRKVQYIGWAKGSQSYEFFAGADLVVFPGRHSVYWEEVAGMGIPMVCKYWEGTTHIDMGGNVKFLYQDSVEEIQTILQELIDNPEEYQNMVDISKEKGKKKFSYREIAKKAIS